MTGPFITRTDTKVAGAIFSSEGLRPFIFSDGFDTNYQYDTLGNLVTVTPSQGNPTSIVYDSLSRKVQMTDPAMGIWYYGYDAAGNLLWQTDAKGQTTRFHYLPGQSIPPAVSTPFWKSLLVGIVRVLRVFTGGYMIIYAPDGKIPPSLQYPYGSTATPPDA
jgi:YD repeat-containing protein